MRDLVRTPPAACAHDPIADRLGPLSHLRGAGHDRLSVLLRLFMISVHYLVQVKLIKEATPDFSAGPWKRISSQVGR